MLRSSCILYACLIMAVMTAGCTSSDEQALDAFTRSVVTHDISLDASESTLHGASLESFRLAIGSAEIVGIGESRHDTHEQIMVKQLLVHHLVQDLDFQILFLEESYPHAESLDRYVTNGEGDLRVLMNQLAGWYLWDVEEMVELLQWIRQINETRDPHQMVRIFGMDITAPAPGVLQVLEFLHDRDLSTQIDADALGLELQTGDFWPATWEAYSSLSDAERLKLSDNYELVLNTLTSRLDEFAETTSVARVNRILLLAQIGKLGNNMFSTSDRAQGGAVRENGMAQVIYHVLEHNMPNSKAIIWTHNLHAAKSTFRMPEFVEGTHEPLGHLLNEQPGSSYLAIGASFGEGSYPPDLPPGERVFERLSSETMDGALGAAVSGDFLLDLRLVKQDSRAADWLSVEREWRAQELNSFLVPGDAFDMVFYVNSISRAQPTPLALQRYQTMGQ